ncbi:MAG TPA: efflux RND transporter periplasmic adaptor subunit [Thermoanaerobaculia bacterium]|nr:efflux RND transporter periplasmic adaptor subunit [Thermoanaerobaculia bacterium]
MKREKDNKDFQDNKDQGTRERVLAAPGVLYVLFMTLALATAACGRGGSEEAANQPPAPIVVGPEDAAVVTQGPVQAGPALTGTLTAEEEATVRAQISGSVLETFAEPGQPVSRGQTLARLDANSLMDAYNSARAAVTNAQSNLQVAQREAERQRVLAQAGAVADRNVETANQSVVSAQAAVAQARSQLSNAEKQLGYTRIVAPFNGVVSERQAAAGDVVQPGTAVYTIVDPSSLELEASIPAEDLGSLSVGAPVEFTVTGYGDRPFRGEITRVNPSADPATRQVRVYAEIPNPGNELVSGLFAEGRIASQSRVGLTVPTAAIDRRMAKPAVALVRNGKVERKEIKLGLTDERAQRVEILE